MGIFSKLFGRNGHSDARSDVRTARGEQSGRPGRRGTEDALLGGGLWRQSHDRFQRAADRFYETAVGIGTEAGDDPAKAPVAQTVSALTARLYAALEEIRRTCTSLHKAYSHAGLIVPAEVRREVGQTPELLTRAGTQAATAAQSALLIRQALRIGDIAGAEYLAESCTRYIELTEQLVAGASLSQSD